MNISESTLKHDYCIGCGICSAVCPKNAISMKYSKYKEFIPHIDKNKCNSCGKCTQYCPQTKTKIIKMANEVSRSKKPNNFGLNENNTFLVAHARNTQNRKKSASGGFTTALLKHLLQNKIIDCVVHAEMKEGKIGDVHYGASISNTLDQIEEKRSSCYGTICFSEVLKQLKNKKKKIAIVSVPCIMRGFTNLFSSHEDYSKNKIITISLACSHAVNGQFADFLSESEGIDKKQKFKLNMRNKDNISDASNYNINFFNGKKDLVKTNRFDSDFTEMWRNYFFAMNPCHYCPDFWGYKADISVKDAWGKWTKDPLGKNIVIIRKKYIWDIVKKMKTISYEKVGFITVANSQKKTTRYKQELINERLLKSFFRKDNIKNGFFNYYILSKTSKKLYYFLGHGISKRILFGLKNIFKILQK